MSKGNTNFKARILEILTFIKRPFQFENLKFAVNQNEYFDKAKYEKFDHYQIVLKDGILISDNINDEGLEISKYKKDNFYEIKKNQILDFNNAFFTSGYEIKVDKNYNVKKPIVIYNYFSKEFEGNNINNKNFIFLDQNAKTEIYEKNIFDKENLIFFTKNLDIELKQDALV